MLSHLFPRRRQRAADGDTKAEPPAKKHKTISEDESLVPTKKQQQRGDQQQQRVFEEPFLLHKIASCLKADDKWKLGATCKDFFVFFALQAQKELDATDASVPGAAFKDRVIVKSLVALELKGGARFESAAAGSTNQVGVNPELGATALWGPTATTILFLDATTASVLVGVFLHDPVERNFGITERSFLPFLLDGRSTAATTHLPCPERGPRHLKPCDWRRWAAPFHTRGPRSFTVV